MPRGGDDPLHWMCRCSVCKRWQSTNPDHNFACGACGGDLIQVDMKAHIAGLPEGKEIAAGGTLVPEKAK